MAFDCFLLLGSSSKLSGHKEGGEEANWQVCKYGSSCLDCDIISKQHSHPALVSAGMLVFTARVWIVELHFR